MKSDRTYLQQQLDAIGKIEQYLGDAEYPTFERDEKTVDAVLKQLEVLGETANRLSDSFQQAHPEIPYRDMRDMRNVLIHGYLGVIRKTVWDTCKDDLPLLKETIQSIMRLSGE